MALQLYNTLTAKKAPFVAIDDNHIKFYVCGPTVYNRVHIGNARPAVVFDTLFRVLNELYPKVTYARNLTDVDDKIIQAALDNNESIDALTKRFTTAYHEDMAAINNLSPTVEPKATEHIDDMLALIQQLIDKGHAYEADGHVLFDVRSMDDYGKLSKRDLDDMLAGARVEVADYKRYAGDFVLWKPANEGEPYWSSPFGNGRPGWHLECSAMIKKHLGETIDIHGGGRDLIFPHHENEIAQSECAHDKPFVNYWLHNGYINIDGDKMSKSLGNFRMVNDLLTQYDGEVLRFALLSAHYRSELNFSEDLLSQAKSTLDTLYGYLQAIDKASLDKVDIKSSAAFKALLDDINTPIAISELHRLGKAVKKGEGDAVAAEFVAVADMLGLLQKTPEQWFQGDTKDGLSNNKAVNAKVAQLNAARANKDYALADSIRDELTEQGVQLTRDGWRRM
ncbi:MAG: cysteine--tRNA ligase [Cellvibrionales bacterium]|nr:cysteine--tRNA ligase [Cellvibrionales bacterium]